MLLKFSLLAKPARVTSEKLELEDTGPIEQRNIKTQGRVRYSGEMTMFTIRNYS